MSLKPVEHLLALSIDSKVSMKVMSDLRANKLATNRP